MIILIIHIIVSCDQNMSLIFYVILISCQASTSVLCLHHRQKTVHCSTKKAYTSEITFLALVPWHTPLSIIYLHAVQIYLLFWLSPYCKTNIFGKMFAKCVKVFICLTSKLETLCFLNNSVWFYSYIFLWGLW